jgi:hypothetical protein
MSLVGYHFSNALYAKSILLHNLRVVSIVAAILLMATAALHSAVPLRVLMWDEQQPEQKRAYGDNFLGETIAAHLSAQPGFV